jgi:hypothetical protein
MSYYMRWTPCGHGRRWLTFVRPVDAKHFNFMRPTLEFHAAMDSAILLFWSPNTKFWRQGRRDAP